MKLEDLPPAKRNQYPCFVGFRVSMDTNKKLDKLKENGKDVSAFIRNLVDEALRSLEIDD